MGDDGGTRRGAGDAPLMDPDTPFFTIGQVSTLLGVPAAQLRRLDEFDFVSPGRTGGNQRRYTLAEIDRLREVISLTDDGISLSGVRVVLELRRQVAALEAEIARLRGED
ncbi:MerR family transcriptional regulator [Georgenia phoenicis]|uniref:MerR family transcriptional regulator n=1 Tax=unclassified Georgenia TaxID=2626815 RepID=UPI0039B11550